MIKEENQFSIGLRKRLQLIQTLQKNIYSKYGEDNYNIFIFGSFLTEAYIPGKSDIDMAIYTPDFRLYLDISADIEDYFTERKIPLDLFYIDIDVEDYIYYKPLSSILKFTEYYPDYLKDFCKRCKDKLSIQ